MLSIAFISLFAFDAFSPDKTILQQLKDFAVHITPSIILIFLLILAWHNELVGGILFSLIGLGFSPAIFLQNYRMNNSVIMSLGIVFIITFPFLIIGILFIYSYRAKRKAHPDSNF